VLPSRSSIARAVAEMEAYPRGIDGSLGRRPAGGAGDFRTLGMPAPYREHGRRAHSALRFPVAQLSVKAGFNAPGISSLEERLIPLREQGVLIAGSGMSHHNLSAFFSKRGNEDSERFDEWLQAAVTAPSAPERAEKLIAWQRAPGAAASHPHPDHLLPPMVAAGAADGDAGVRTYNGHIFGKAVSGFQFG